MRARAKRPCLWQNRYVEAGDFVEVPEGASLPEHFEVLREAGEEEVEQQGAEPRGRRRRVREEA